MNADALIFDLDGTLWDASEATLDVWNTVISDVEEVKEPVTLEQVVDNFGLQLPQIGENLFPYLDVEKREELYKKFRNIESDYMRKKGGILFKNLEEVLEKLFENHELYIVSNCQKGYIEAFLDYTKLEKYFKDFECSGNTDLLKGENIKLIIERNNIKSSLYIGDAQVDCDGAKLAGIPFVYADYGFGQVDHYDYKINEIEELIKLVNCH